MVTLASYARRAGTQLIFRVFWLCWLLRLRGFCQATRSHQLVSLSQRSADERLLQLQRRWRVFLRRPSCLQSLTSLVCRYASVLP